MFANGVEMLIRDDAQDLGFDNGIMFEGEKGRFFVNRGKLTAVELSREQPVFYFQEAVEGPWPE